MLVVQLESAVATLMVQRLNQSILLNEEMARFFSVASVVLRRESNIFEYLHVILLRLSFNLHRFSNN